MNGQYNASVLLSCRRHRWLTEREYGFILTTGGIAALAHYDASVVMEKLWNEPWKTR